MRLVLDVTASPRGRFEGIVEPDSERAIAFCGTFELVAVLDALLAGAAAAPAGSPESRSR